jgi:hypothetical protein
MSPEFRNSLSPEFPNTYRNSNSFITLSQWREFTDEESLIAFRHDLTARSPDTLLLGDELLELLRRNFPR